MDVSIGVGCLILKNEGTGHCVAIHLYRIESFEGDAKETKFHMASGAYITAEVPFDKVLAVYHELYKDEG